MQKLDLIVRNAQVATSGDAFAADIGIRDGRIVTLADGIDSAESRDIDAVGRTVTPGGIDGHCHINQPTTDGSVCADDFASATHLAVCGETTTVIPFALQMKAMSLRETVDDYHQRATGRALIDYASTNVARMHGLYPRKGTIGIGADADLVIWDEGDRVVANDRLHHNVDYTPYEGIRIRAWPAMTLSRAEVVWDGAAAQGAAGRGEFLPCESPSPARPAWRQTSGLGE